MGNFADSVARGVREGRFSAMLQEYCRQWHKNPSHYVIDNAIAHLVEAFDPDSLFEMLTDNEFRRLKREQFGTNALRSDLQKGLDFFSKRHADLLRYIQVLFLEQRVDLEGAESRIIHERYCREFSDFLQLNMPPAMRQDIGVHRVLNRIFPIAFQKYSDVDRMIRVIDEDPETSAVIELVDYELGIWRCKCGALHGQEKRFDYACKCGTIRGNGLLDGNSAPCSDCGQPPTYALCPSCGTRVILDLIWRMQEGNVHPSELKIPLTVTFLIKQTGEPQVEKRLTLMHLPLMLGIREREERIVFEMPDLFWLDTTSDSLQLYRAPAEDKQIFVLEDSIRYDRQTELRKIFEAILRRTFVTWPSRRASLKAKLKRVIFKNQSYDTLTGFTEGFTKRLVRVAGFQRAIDVVRMVDLSFECAVAGSPLLSHNMAFVNRNLLRPGALSASFVTNEVIVLRSMVLRQDVLTPTPLGKPRSPALDDDGIVRVGTIVRPGEILVGIESPNPVDEWSAEDKLLAAIFGESAAQKKDSSVIYQGVSPARVIAVNVIVSEEWKGVSLRTGGGKSVKNAKETSLDRDELVRIAVSLVSEQPIGVGDILYADDGTDAVVCQTAEGPTLAKIAGCFAEPDLVVAPDHPWVSSQGSNSQLRYIRIGVRSDTLVGQEALSRAIGYYQIIRGIPLGQLGDPNPAQGLYAEDFDWLFACGASDIAFELFGPHCDCMSWRVQMYEDAITDKVRLANLAYEFEGLPQDLSESPSETMRYFAFLLRGLGIKATIVPGSQPGLRFHLITEAERLVESRGEVTKPETINYRRLKPEKDGLFCEAIFGPTKDWQCYCGKYKSARYKGEVCDRCGVEVTRSSVRRERVGHISIPVPLVHPLYLTTICNHLASKFNLDPNDLEAVIYCKKHLEIDTMSDSGPVATIIGGKELRSRSGERQKGICHYYGGHAIRKLLGCLQAREDIDEISEDWQGVIMDSIGVIPPDRRPMIRLSDGRFATSDLNDLYRRAIIRCNRLKGLIELSAPDVIIHNEQHMLQEAVDALFDNLQLSNPVTGRFNRPLKSFVELITDLARGQPNLLEGLLQHPVDYSAQTRLVAADTENLDTVLLPERLAWNLLRPLIIRNLTDNTSTVRRAKIEISARTDRAHRALRDVASKTIILAGPSSSSWRLVALRPQIITGLALIIHPDLMNILGWENLGKQVRLFAVLSEEAEQEGKKKLLPSRLLEHGPSSLDFARIREEKNKSIFFIRKDDLISELSRRAFVNASYTLGLYDYLVMCIRDNTFQIKTSEDIVG